MTLLLQVLKLPTSKAQNKLLQQSSHILQESDNSAFSIAPSRRSSSIHSCNRRDSAEITDFVYQRLAFEEDLFAATVYKRRYGDPMVHSVSGTILHQRIKRASGINLSMLYDPEKSDLGT